MEKEYRETLASSNDTVIRLDKTDTLDELHDA